MRRRRDRRPGLDDRGGRRSGPRPSARRRCPPRPARRHPRGGRRDDRVGHRGAGRMTRNRATNPTRRAGQSAGRAGKPSREAIGRSRGGLTSKIHLAADRRCRPISRVTSAGQRHDSLGLRPVMAAIRIRRRGPGRPRTRPGRVLGDKAYSSRGIRAYLRRRRIKATIPEPADQKKNRLRRGSTGGRPPRFDTEIYKQRNVVERCHQQAQGPPGGGHPLRQTRLHIPRNHRPRLDQDLAPRPRPMIRGTGSSPVA